MTTKKGIDFSVLKDFPSNVTIRTVLMTPEVAGLALAEHNTKNRKQKGRLLYRLCKVIDTDEWELNYQPALIGRSGRILDGQHRFEAIHSTGKACPILLIEGVDDSVYDTLDSGATRTTGDVLGMNGEVNVNQLAATCRWVQRIRTGGLSLGGSAANQMSTREVESFIAKNPDVRDSVSSAITNRSGLVPVSPMAALHFLFCEKDKELADELIEGMKSGGLVKKAFNAFRERMIQNTSRVAKLPPVVVVALAIKSWNAARQRTTVANLRWTPQEEFPAIE